MSRPISSFSQLPRTLLLASQTMKSRALSQPLVLITRPQHPVSCHPSPLPGPLLPPTHTLPPHSLRVIRFLSISRLRSLPAHLATRLRTHSWEKKRGRGGTERGTWGSWANMRDGRERRAEPCQRAVPGLWPLPEHSTSHYASRKSSRGSGLPCLPRWEEAEGCEAPDGGAQPPPRQKLRADGAGKAENRPGLGLRRS